MDQKFVEKYGSWALITGASSGIGVEFANQIAEKGLNIVLVARRKQLLETVAADLEKKYNIETTPIEADLSKDGFQSDILDATKDPTLVLLFNTT